MIYFIQSGRDGPIKIGVSDDPVARLRELQSASPRRLTIIGCRGGWHPLESRLHARFSRLRTDGGQEWFESDPELLDYIDEHTTDDVPPDLRLLWERDRSDGIDAIVSFWSYQEKLDDWWMHKWGCQLELWRDVRPIWMRSHDGDLRASYGLDSDE